MPVYGDSSWNHLFCMEYTDIFTVKSLTHLHKPETEKVFALDQALMAEAWPVKRSALVGIWDKKAFTALGHSLGEAFPTAGMLIRTRLAAEAAAARLSSSNWPFHDVTVIRPWSTCMSVLCVGDKDILGRVCVCVIIKHAFPGSHGGHVSRNIGFQFPFWSGTHVNNKQTLKKGKKWKYHCSEVMLSYIFLPVVNIDLPHPLSRGWTVRYQRLNKICSPDPLVVRAAFSFFFFLA